MEAITFDSRSLMRNFDLCDEERLTYEIHRFSSFSTNYYPENILVDCPTDQSSRWSAQTNNPPQFLTLKLRRPSIVGHIKFGKFEKSHVCNLKKFRIYGGLDQNHLVELLEGGLKNDSTPEVFTLRNRTEDGSEGLPILYLKIVPLLSWGPTFNFSIWYIELHGQDDPMYTTNSLQNYNKLREVEIVRLCLKHFRQQGYDLAFKALQSETSVVLESNLVSELHDHIVVRGDFETAEAFIEQCVAMGYMDDYLQTQDYKHSWRKQDTQGQFQPGTRGGHQLVMDTKKRLVYLYGGWDGFHDLSDLWVYDITGVTWTRLYENSEQFNGPTPRSCHKMVYDPVSENIFMLGRYLDNSIRTIEYIKSDFFLYDTRLQTWLQICDDTSQVGGPQLVYDHQMCIDAEKRTIYVFGGKILTPRSVTNSATPSSSEPEYSGLFSYHIATNTWTQIMVDCHHPTAAQVDVLSIKSRITHCMVFHPRNRKLYIYGGQRGKEDIHDFITYNVDTHELRVINQERDIRAAYEMKNEPSPGFTLRATIDCARNEIYVFSSLSKFKDRRDIQHIDASNSFWVYSIQKNKWSLIYNSRPNVSDDRTASTYPGIEPEQFVPLEPCPRYAHQLVYDEDAKVHYLFGGNPGKTNLPQLRLDDFWIFILQKPNRLEILTRCRFLMRKLRYEEMARQNRFQAIEYLRRSVSAVIDHSDREQVDNFHRLASLLFLPDDPADCDDKACSATPSLLAKAVESNTRNNRNGLNAGSTAHGGSIDSAACVDSNGSTRASSNNSGKSCRKRPRQVKSYDVRSRRAYLFNKLVQFLPQDMVQPQKNLSDFVIL